MLLNCLKFRENIESKNLKVVNIESKNLKVVKTKNGRIMLFSKYAVCNSKKSKFIKEQEASRLLSSSGTKTPLSKIPFVGALLFQRY